MKKSLKFLVFALAMAFTTSAMAQLSIGPRAAVNFSTVSFDPDEDININSLTGFAFGAAIEIGAGEMFAIQPEVLFSQHGFSPEDGFLVGVTDFKFKYSYVQLPLLAKLKFGAEAAAFNVFVGPHLGLGIGDIKLQGEVLGEKDEDTQLWEESNYKKFDFGVTGGIGVSIGAGPGKLGLDVRYQLGLANLLDEADDDESAANRNVQIGLSYLIPIGGN